VWVICIFEISMAATTDVCTCKIRAIDRVRYENAQISLSEPHRFKAVLSIPVPVPGYVDMGLDLLSGLSAIRFID
jgi:hypothetical protein